MRTTRAAAVVTALALVGLVLSIGAVWSRPGSGPPVDAPEPAPSVVASGEGDRPAPAPSAGAGEVGRAPASVRTAPTRVAPRPVRVTIPVADIDSPVRPVGVAPDGQMQLPARPDVLGWYRFGPPPGAGSGSAVIAGHLDSTRFGLGPLVRLREVEVGARVDVTLASGATKSYVVRQVARYERQALPAEVFARTGPERLRLVTCGGEYDEAAGGYQQNLVLTAVPR